MSLNVGELTAYLDVDRSAYQRGLREARGDLSKFGADTGRDADKIGRDQGGKLAQGVRQGIIRNSPLIVAAIGGALTAGGPLIATAATGMFAGVGIAAAAQSVAVRSAWRDTWEGIRDDTVAASAPIQVQLVGLADRVSNRFQLMGPQIGAGFAAAAPQIDVFADGVVGLAENALPGLVRAVQAGMPVTQGFASLLEKTGSGLTGLLDNISSHGPAAGQVFDQLGDTIDTLLPLLGELLGQGAELATTVLPMVNGGLGLLLTVTEGLGPALPIVVAGVTGLKVAQAAQGWVGGLSDRFSNLQGALTPTNAALGAVGIAAGLLMGVVQESDARTREWTEALNEGGHAADQARAEMDKFTAGLQENSGVLTGASIFVNGAAGAFSVYKDDVEEAERANRDYWNSLTPIEQAQQKVAEWTDTLARRLADETATTAEVNIAKERLAYWSGQEETAQKRLDDATRSVTAALVDQADQALAAIDSGFAYRRSTDQLEDAQANLVETIKNRTNKDKELRTTSEDVERAQLAVEEATKRSAEAYGQQQADLSGLDKQSAEYAATLQQETLKELYRLREAAGPAMKGAIDTQIRALERAGVKLDDTSRRTRNASSEQSTLRTRIIQLPDGKKIVVQAPTGSAREQADLLQRKIDGLRGRTVNITAQVNTSIKELFSGWGGVRNARGNIIEAYADGGLRPMRGGLATIVPPNTWRVIGDRVADDEAYIPINSSTRSRELLGETASRMGYGLTKMAAGGINVTARFDASAARRQLDDLASAAAKKLEPATGMAAALSWARSQVGKPYIWGGVGPAGYDCSGFMSALVNVARGRNPYSRLGATSSFPWAGFAPGYGAFTIGSTRNAGGGIGHMAGTIMGVNVESAGGVGVRVGPSARGASNSLFGTRAHLAMANGGVIREPVVGLGMTSGRSYSFGERGPETVTPGEHRPSTASRVINDNRVIHVNQMSPERLAAALAAQQRNIEWLYPGVS